MKKRLIELLEYQLPGVDLSLGSGVDSMVDEWSHSPCPELSVILVELRFLALVHQTHHWVSRGDEYYGDHLLFARLYEGVQGEIDTVAEKAIGLGDESNVNLQLQVTQLQRLSAQYGPSSTLPMPDQLAKRSLKLESDFLFTVAHLVDRMKAQGTLTRGLDNLLAGIEDAHEGHVYLLKQRCGG